MADEILCTIDDHIATITLNRPEKRNALNSAALRALSATVAGLEERPDVRVVVIAALAKLLARDAICAKWASNRRPEARQKSTLSRCFTTSKPYVIPPLWCTAMPWPGL